MEAGGEQGGGQCAIEEVVNVLDEEKKVWVIGQGDWGAISSVRWPGHVRRGGKLLVREWDSVSGTAVMVVRKRWCSTRLAENVAFGQVGLDTGPAVVGEVPGVIFA